MLKLGIESAQHFHIFPYIPYLDETHAARPAAERL